MDSITFKNFRQFKDETTFELKNINILVGKNNSGKSTLTKGLRLYINNIMRLRVNSFNNIFSYKPFFLFGDDASDNSHVGTFGRAYSTNSNEDFIDFSVRIGKISIETKVSRYYENPDGTIVDCFLRTSAPISRITIKDDNMGSIYIFDFEKGTQIIEIDAREDGKCYQTWRNRINDMKTTPERYRSSEKHLGRSHFYDPDDEKYVNGLEKQFSFKIKEYIRIEIPLYKTQFDGSLYSSLLEGALQNFLDIDPEGEWIKDKNQLLQKLVKYDDNEEASAFHFFSHVFSETRSGILDFINSERIEYIEAHSVTHSVVYNSSDKNDYMAQTILNYLNENIKEDDPEKMFIEDWMMKFEIGEDFRIESIGGECYKLDIIEDVDHPENTISLLDKGVGSNQIMILLLRLATIMHKNRGASIPPMVIIEEPEQNLHPKLQSCLADLFREIYLYPKKENPQSRGISFLIETHSEYLVRKSQVLVAKKKSSEANPFAVFYMETGKEPRQIRYQDDGVFYDDFGDGFYDEAISLTEEIV